MKIVTVKKMAVGVAVVALTLTVGVWVAHDFVFQSLLREVAIGVVQQFGN